MSLTDIPLSTLDGTPTSLAEYAVSKAGIANWTRATAQQLIERGLRDKVLAASEVDASASVPALRSGVFAAY